jgi:hypothetical protein
LTIQDLIDHIARAADDSDASYATAALTWLNLTRADIANSARWRSAVRVDTFTTSAGTTDGLYAIAGYEHLAEDWLYDETNDALIEHESKSTLEAIDTCKETSGNPTWWGDAGGNDFGQRQIYLWPVPNGTFTIRFTGYKLLADLTSADTSLSVDPFFGPIAPWSNVLQDGMRYYHDLDNNEDSIQIGYQERRFRSALKRKKRVNDLAPISKTLLDNVRSRGGSYPVTARLDPGHFRNR